MIQITCVGFEEMLLEFYLAYKAQEEAKGQDTVLVARYANKQDIRLIAAKKAIDAYMERQWLPKQ